MELVFALVFFVGAAPFWTLMIVAPRWWWTKRVVSSPWIVAPTLVFWFLLAIPRMGDLLPAVARPTLAAWQELLADPAVLTAMWAQIIAWDLFVGRWMYRDGLRRGMPRGLMSVLLVVAIMLSPLAVPSYLVLRRVLGHAPRDELALPPQPAPDHEPEPVRSGWHRPLMWFAAYATVLELIALIGLLVDDRELVGAPIWAKPAKFVFSFGLYAVTMAWLLTLPRRRLKQGRVLGTVVAGACFFEVSVVVLQTFRGHRSHFNVATTFDATMWGVMAASIVVLWFANVAGAVMLMRERHADRTALWALRLGTLITLAGMAVAFMMTTNPTVQQPSEIGRVLIGAHSVGVPDGGPGMPITGWNTTAGDLRPPHFVGIHGLHAVLLFTAVLGLLVTRVPRLRDEVVRVRLVWTFSAGYAGLLALTTWQALRRQPLVAPDTWTLGGLGVLLVGTLGLTVWAWRSGVKTDKLAPIREEVLV